MCNEDGRSIPLDSTPLPRELENDGPDDWAPYDSRLDFETADFIYYRNQMSQGNTDFLTDL